MSDRIFDSTGKVSQDFGQRDNDDRADAARAALEAYTDTNTAQYRHESIETRVGDLICDLLHLVKRDGNPVEWVSVEKDPDFRDPLFLLGRARSYFEEEEEEENGGEEATFEGDETL